MPETDLSADRRAGIEPGQTFEVVQLSPCVGGLVRTWGSRASRLWSVRQPGALASAMGRGLIARTEREQNRYREVGLLNEDAGLLILQPPTPTEVSGQSLEFDVRPIELGPPHEPGPSTQADFLEVLGTAVDHCVETDGFLVVERGGWDAPIVPYCLFVIAHETVPTSVVEAAPAPVGASLWASALVPGAKGATLSAPATPQTVAAVPRLIADACSTWEAEPWDLALTFGRRG